MDLSPALDGVYTVHDSMNRRRHHCLDVLVAPHERFDVFQPKVKIRQVSLWPNGNPSRANRPVATRQASEGLFIILIINILIFITRY